MTRTFTYYLRFLTLLLCFSATALFAQDDTPADTADQPSVAEDQAPYPYPDFGADERSFQEELFNMLTTLGLFLFGLLALAWVFNRLKMARNLQMNESSNIQILERRVIAPKGVLYLIEVMGQVMIVSESPAGLQYLTTIPVKEGEEPSFQAVMQQQEATAGG